MEVEVRFEPSGRNGVVPVGTYLIDAARRFGIRIEIEAENDDEFNPDVVKILRGAEILSEPTKTELEHLSPERRKKGERLASQAKIERTGEITIMTTDKPKPEVPPFDQFKKEFAELPLEEKIKKLVDLEAIALSDTFNFVLNLPYFIGEKIRDGVAEFGFMKEEAEKKAQRPAEHTTEEKTEDKAEQKAAKTARPKAARAKTETAKKTSARKRTAKPTENNETSA
jgi:ferredoxin